MRSSPLASLAICLWLAPSAFAADALGPTPGIPRPDPHLATPFQAKLDEMQGLIAKLRVSADPVQRQRLLRQQARTVREAMWIASPGATAGPRQPPLANSRPMPPQPPMWSPRERPPTHVISQAQRSVAAVDARRVGPARYQALENQLQELHQRLDAQQQILDEILKYREPIERLLGQQG